MKTWINVSGLCRTFQVKIDKLSDYQQSTYFAGDTLRQEPRYVLNLCRFAFLKSDELSHGGDHHLEL